MDSKEASLSLLCFLLISILQISMATALPTRPSEGVRLYLGTEKRVLPNYSLLSENQISAQSGDGLWCQSANNGTNIGTWYQPNGRPIDESNGGSSSFPLHSLTEQGQTGLIRPTETGLPIEGLYRCVILNENGTSEELVVGIYTETSYNDQVGPSTNNETLLFNLLSTRETNPPVFTLTFNVTNRPPTTVSCTLNNSLLLIDNEKDIICKVIRYTDPIVVMVTVTIMKRERGEYKCSVSNSRVDNSSVFAANTSTRLITVTYPVSNLQAVRFNSTSISLSWSPSLPSLVSQGSLNVEDQQGYEIYIQFDNTSSVIVHTTTNTSINLTNSLLKDTSTSYEILVVAFGGDLPSLPISVTTIQSQEDKSIFEVCGGNFLECDSWKDSTKFIVRSIFKSSLIQIISDVCTDCDHTTNTHLTLTNDTIHCSNDNTVTYRVTLTNTDIDSTYTTDQILTLIRNSLSNGVTIHDGSNVLTLRNNCSFPINEISSTTTTLPISDICTPLTITKVTTVTLTQSPSQTSIEIQPTIIANTNNNDNDNPVMSNLRFIVIGGSVLIIAVLLLVILTVCIVIVAKIKYDRLKTKLFTNLKSNMSDFEMIECDAYQSTDELRTVASAIEPYSTLRSTIQGDHHHDNIESFSISIASHSNDESPYCTLSLSPTTNTHCHNHTGDQCDKKESSVVKDETIVKKDGPHIYEHIK